MLLKDVFERCCRKMLLKHVVVAKHVVAEPVVAENINVVAKRVVVEAEAGAYLGALPAKENICVT